MGQKDGEKWTAAVDLQPMLLLPRSLLGHSKPKQLPANPFEQAIPRAVSAITHRCVRMQRSLEPGALRERPGISGSLQHFKQPVQPTLVDRYHGLFAHLGFSVVGH